MIFINHKITILNIITFIGTITGILTLGSLNSARQICGYFGTISCLCFSIVACTAQNYLNLLTYIINMFVMYIPIIFNKKWRKANNINKLSKKQWPWIIVSIIIVYIVIEFIIKSIGIDPRPAIDATTLTIDIYGSILCFFKYKDQYIFWLILNVLNVVLWLISFIQGAATLAIAVNFIIYLLSTLVGIFNSPWFKKESS